MYYSYISAWFEHDQKQQKNLQITGRIIKTN